MSTDPATAAAQRGREAVIGRTDFWDQDGLEALNDATVASAREALAPIRARHHKVPANARHDNGIRVCAHCLDDRGIPVLWPCADALDAYPPEEL